MTTKEIIAAYERVDTVDTVDTEGIVELGLDTRKRNRPSRA